MPIRKPTPQERDAMVRSIRDFIANHGRGAYKRAHAKAEEELAPLPTPYQLRQLEKQAEWAEVDRELEQARQAKAAAEKAEYQRRRLTLETRHAVYKEEGIVSGIGRDPLWILWRRLEVTRLGLHKSIRATLWARGMVRDDACFVLADAGNMRVGVEALIAWERRRLEMWSRRLERRGDRFRVRHERQAQRPVEEVRRLSAEGHGATEIAKRVGISRKSVWRIVRAGRVEQAREATQREEP